MPNFSFSTAQGGPAVAHPIDFGTLSNTGGQKEIPVFVSHDSVQDLQNVGVYLQPFAGTGYVGLYGPSQDYLDFLDWGLTASKGVISNMDAAATSAPLDKQFKSGPSATGAAATNAIPLATDMFTSMNSTAAGHFPTGDTGHMTMRMAIPSSEQDAGLRMASLFLRFDQ